MILRLGLIGLGNMGSVHARYLLAGKCPRVQLAAVCDLIPQRTAEFVGVPVFPDSRSMIRSGKVDAVLIATPHYDHTAIGIDALEQGLHVLTEKPISVHVADCRRLISAYDKRPKKEQVFAAMFQERTFARNRKIRELIASNELGHINRIAWITTDWFRSEAYYRSGGWRASWRGEGGGVLTNQCPHRLDLLQWWFGSPSSVRATAAFGRYHDIEVEDEVTAQLEWENGCTGVFVTSTGEAPGVNRLEIAAERGLVVVEGGIIHFARNVVETSTFSRTTADSFIKPEVWHIEVPFSGQSQQHVDIVNNFADAIFDGVPLIAKASEGIRAVEIANAMILSAKTGEKVQLPLDANRYLALHEQLVAGSRWHPGQNTPAAADPANMAASFGL